MLNGWIGGTKPPPLTVAGGSFDADTTAWEAAVVGAGGTVSGTQKGYVDTLIKAIKSAESMGTSALSTKFDRIYLLAAENITQATYDLAARSALTYVDFGDGQTFAGEWTTNGYQSLGQSELQWNFIPSSSSIITTNSVSCGIGVATNRTVDNGFDVQLGSIDGGGNGIQISALLGGGLIKARANSAVFGGPTNPDGNARGGYIINRDDSSHVSFYKGQSGSGASALVSQVGSFTSSSVPTTNKFAFSALDAVQGGNTDLQQWGFLGVTLAAPNSVMDAFNAYLISRGASFHY